VSRPITPAAPAVGAGASRAVVAADRSAEATAPDVPCCCAYLARSSGALSPPTNRTIVKASSSEGKRERIP
jgi:hypothetical protein